MGAPGVTFDHGMPLGGDVLDHVGWWNHVAYELAVLAGGGVIGLLGDVGSVLGLLGGPQDCFLESWPAGDPDALVDLLLR